MLAVLQTQSQFGALARAGTAAYPATMFTTASTADAMQIAASISGPGHVLQWTTSTAADQSNIRDHSTNSQQQSLAASTCRSDRGNSSLQPDQKTPGAAMMTSQGFTQQPLLILGGFSCSMHSHIILKGFDLNLEQGRHCIILGPSGSGKSTIIRALAGLWPYTVDSISVTPFVSVLDKPWPQPSSLEPLWTC